MNNNDIIKFSFLVCMLGVFVIPAKSIMCYRCNNTNHKHQFQCNEFLTSDIDMVAESCDDVFGAQYCVKHVGRYEALGIKCYQCASATEWTCQESVLTTEALKPESCDHVYDAQYCIKTIGTYGGGIGTKRYCSALHMGNFCDYAKNIGDTLEYRTCVYTCSSDGCNPASSVTANLRTISFIMIVTFLYVLCR